MGTNQLSDLQQECMHACRYSHGTFLTAAVSLVLSVFGRVTVRCIIIFIIIITVIVIGQKHT